MNWSCMRLLFAFLLCGFVRCAFVDDGLTKNASSGIVSCCVRRRGEGRRRGGGGDGQSAMLLPSVMQLIIFPLRDTIREEGGITKCSNSGDLMETWLTNDTHCI